MGWKSVKEHYGIGHIVHVAGGNLNIGSAFIHDLIVITPEGCITQSWDSLSGDLARYHRDITADPALFARLFAQEDSFTTSIPVYAFRNGDIIEHACEKPGWPNVTHDGKLMYDDAFFENRDEAVEMARRDAAIGIRSYEERVAELRKALESAEEALKGAKAALAKLEGEQGTPVPLPGH